MLLLAAGRTPAQNLQIEPQPGWVIFDPSKETPGAYRYGPSIILNDDGSIDAWFSSPGGQGADGTAEWDWIRYKRSTDGGRTWTPEQIVARPSPGSRDRISLCDPGVIRFGGFYYLGVTAVDNEAGMCNEVFVSRSTAPAGPYEKWNGTGWGGNPQPIVPFREPKDAWGAGEPSFVKVGPKLFIYSTIWSHDAAGKPIAQTHVATAPADDPNWPARITHHGAAFERVAGEDSTDVKYVDATGIFLAMATASRMTPDSYMTVRESKDGLQWSAPRRLDRVIEKYCHNMGISGTAEGHLDLSRPNFIAYAYSDGTRPGNSWAYWFTRLNPTKFSVAPGG